MLLDWRTELRNQWLALGLLGEQLSKARRLLHGCRGDYDLYTDLMADLVLVEAKVEVKQGVRYKAYGDFCRQYCGTYNRMTGSYDCPEGSPFRCRGSNDIFHAFVFDALPLPKDGVELKRLESQVAREGELFEVRDISNEADAHYGRRAKGVFHVPTNRCFHQHRSHEGSLGS